MILIQKDILDNKDTYLNFEASTWSYQCEKQAGCLMVFASKRQVSLFDTKYYHCI
ncbi:hypothetical protein PAT01_39460 [Pseudoalteromonas atlantica]|uniref:Uncharacterized protein n=1 Tax=Pseudoalteromonas atlantica TaxID=288 RepID=A0ABQ0UJL3_PSEAF|nr:hypothetical protein PAT01_39460 [Pseudoalteromonas atlantica]